MKVRIWLAFVLAFALLLSAAGGVAAKDSTSEEKGELVVTAAPVYGTLLGNSGGAFWFERVAYPGNSTQITIGLDYHPGDPVMTRGVGFNVYGADGRLIGAAALTDEERSGEFQLAYANAKAETLTIQVFNYISGVTLSFGLWVQGLPAPAAAPAATPLATPAPVAAPALAQAAGGSLAGTSSGTFARYNVRFPSDALATLTMNYAPTNNLIARGVGFTVYGPAGEVATGADSSTPGMLQASFTPDAGAQYLVLVFNYIDGLKISYSLSGLPAPAYAVDVVDKPGLGRFLVDGKGMTLYMFIQDTAGTASAAPVTACLDKCLVAWPVFYVEKLTLPATLNASDFTVITRPDGAKQLAYKGLLLYYWFKDMVPGDTLGQGVAKAWYVVSPK
jgi:predicted lipoprotein with Yx(FWY)xxD motif